MRIAFLGSATSWYLGDLRRAAGDRHTIEPVEFGGIASSITGAQVSLSSSNKADEPIAIGKFDAVLVRTMPTASLEQVVFRMDSLAQLEANGVLVVNPAKTIEAAVDKYLTTAKLARAGIPVPRTFCCQTSDEAACAFEHLGGSAVLKPIFGGEGRGITRLDDPALANRAFRMLEQLGAVIYLQEFVEHEGFDLRVLLIGDQVLAIRRTNPNDWRTNVALGGKAEPCSPPDSAVDLAIQSAEEVGAKIAGVDLLQRPDGSWVVLEVNAVPGWQATARATGIDVAKLVLDMLAC